MSDLETLEARVAQDRDALARSLDTLTDTFAPDRLASQVSASIKGYGGELGGQAVQAAKSNPAAFALIGAGVALLLSGAGRSAKSHDSAASPNAMSDGFDERVAKADATMKAEMTGQSMSTSALHLRAAIDRGLDKLPPKARQRVLKARVAAVEAQERVERAARKGAAEVSKFHDKQPLVVGALALGAGALIAALLPRTEREDRVLGARRDALMAEAERVLSEEISALKTSAAQHLEASAASLSGQRRI